MTNLPRPPPPPAPPGASQGHPRRSVAVETSTNGVTSRNDGLLHSQYTPPSTSPSPPQSSANAAFAQPPPSTNAPNVQKTAAPFPQTASTSQENSRPSSQSSFPPPSFQRRNPHPQPQYGVADSTNSAASQPIYASNRAESPMSTPSAPTGLRPPAGPANTYFPQPPGQVQPQHYSGPTSPHSVSSLTSYSSRGLSTASRPPPLPPPLTQAGMGPPPPPTATRSADQYIAPQSRMPPPPPNGNYGHPPPVPPGHAHAHAPPPPPLHDAHPGAQQPGMPPAYQQDDRPRIDPSQIPRSPLFTRPQDGTVPVYRPFNAIQGDRTDLPPPADSRFVVMDDGNASPDLMRSSVYAFPMHRGMWHKTGDLPLGILCTPLAAHSEDFVARPRVLPNGSVEDWEDPQRVPLVTDTEPPPRCGQCQAYVNPFFGRDGTCNLCGSRNRRLTNVVAGLPMQFGTVDYEVSGPYITRERPVEPIQLYAIDLTCPHLLRYLPILEQLGEDMARHFSRQPDCQLTPRMGICLVSSHGVVLYGHENKGRYSIVSDVTEQPFSPFPLSEWTFDLSTEEGLHAWKAFLNEKLKKDIGALKNLAKQKNAYGLDGLELSCGGAALAFLADALAESGGRGTLISWRRPNFGVGSLSHREEQPKAGRVPRDDCTPYTPLQFQTKFISDIDEAAAEFYRKIGARSSKNCVSLNVLLHSNSPQFLDLATLGEVCRVSCGKLVVISASDWEEAFRGELSRQLQSFAGWDAIFKVRCSSGVQVKSFLSSPGVSIDGLAGPPELELASVSPNTCIAVELEHRVGGIPKENRFLYVQTALLHSTLSGKRRVRVTTLAIRTCSIANDVYRSIDFGAMTTMLMREAVTIFRKPPPAEESDTLRRRTRDAFYHKCVLILASYRENTPAMSAPNSQLLLPEKLQLLPLFCMCLMKSPMLRPGIPRRSPLTHASQIAPPADERALFSWHVAHANPATASLMVHPNIFSVDTKDDGIGEWQQGPEGYGFIRMADPILPSMASLKDDGIYLLDNGFRIFLYIGRDASEEGKALASSRDSDLGSLIERLVWQMRTFTSTTRGSETELRPTYAPIVTVMERRGHEAPLESNVLELMVDDAIAGEKDYVEFLCTLHRRIRERLGMK